MSLYANGTSESETDWEILYPLIDEEGSKGKTGTAIFKLFSPGVEINRDDWMYDFSEANLERKIGYLIKHITVTDQDISYRDYIESNSDSENHSKRGLKKEYEKGKILPAAFRPYC